MHSKTIASTYRPTPATLALIALNLLLYACMLWQGSDPFEPGSDDMILWGASYAPHLLEGQWWRLITSQFVHFGLLHLGVNLFILYHIGLILERYIGSKKFLLIYLFSGLGASLASLWWYWGKPCVAAGASGAIFGLYGAYIAMLTSRLFPLRERAPLLANTLMFVGYNVLFGFEPDVDNAAHIGGLITGLILGYGSIPLLKCGREWVGNVALVSALALLFTCGALLLDNLKSPLILVEQDTLVFYDLVDELLDLEAKLSEKAERLNKVLLSDEILPGWEKALNMIAEMQNLELSEEDAAYRTRLHQWVHQSIEYYQAYSEST